MYHVEHSLIILFLMVISDDDLPVVYMEDHCRLHIRKYVLDNARVYVDDNVHVELTNRPEESNELACLVTFSSRDQDWRLLLHFEQVDINYNPGTVDRLAFCRCIVFLHVKVRPNKINTVFPLSNNFFFCG